MGCCDSKEEGALSPLLDKEVKKGGHRKSNFVLRREGTVQSRYEMDESGDKSKLGEGAFGFVRSATHKTFKTEVAVKMVSKAHLKNTERFRQEIAIMKNLDHPNIIKLYETYEDKAQIHLVMEKCEGGDLFDRIIKEKTFKETDSAHLVQQVLRAVYYMHENGVCHRDLKPENFLFLDDSDIEDSTIKVIDFGLSTPFEKGQTMTTMVGTPFYVAPQVLSGSYDEKCDLWSVGVIMYVLLCGYPPFNGKNEHEITSKVRVGQYSFNPEYWDGISNECKDLIRKLLKFKPVERYSAADALHDSWVEEKAPSSTVQISSRMIDKLRAFRNLNRFQKLAASVVAQTMDSTNVKKLRDIFVSLDTNGDGMLTVEELKAGMQKGGLEIPSDLQEIMESIDCDGNGVLEYSEFLTAALDKKAILEEQRLLSAFQVFDRDGDGFITRNELQAILQQDLDETWEELDKNEDGKVEFQEFLLMMSSNFASQVSRFLEDGPEAEFESLLPTKKVSMMSMIMSSREDQVDMQKISNDLKAMPGTTVAM